jgi:hypothetical protein
METPKISAFLVRSDLGYAHACGVAEAGGAAAGIGRVDLPLC